MKNDGELASELQSFRASELRKGFTLVEIVIVIAILTVVFGFSLSGGSNFFYDQTLIGERDNLISLLRNARNRALDNVNQSSHGVEILADQYVAFDGSFYATRNQAYDLALPRSQSVTITGPAEIVFNALDGASNVSGTIAISIASGTVRISVNSEGKISW